MQTMTTDEYLKSLKGSKLEALFDAEWERLVPKGMGIEQPEREQCLIPGSKWRCDRVWRNSRVVVEIDGGQWTVNGGRHNSDDDRDKINMLILNGWRVLRYSGTMLRNDPDGVIKQVVGAVLGIKAEHIKRLILPKKARSRRKVNHEAKKVTRR